MRLLRRHRMVTVPAERPDGLPFPPLPRHIIEQLNDCVTDFLVEPGPATAFALGVQCEYLGHFDPEVQIAARSILMLWLRDVGHALDEDDERAMDSLMADL